MGGVSCFFLARCFCAVKVMPETAEVIWRGQESHFAGEEQEAEQDTFNHNDPDNAFHSREAWSDVARGSEDDADSAGLASFFSS